MSTARPERADRASAHNDAPRSVRWRLWAATLAVALVPTLAGMYLVSSLTSPSDPAPAVAHAIQTTETAADLLARELAIEARLLVAAAEPGIASLANGLDRGVDKQLAARVLADLRGDDGAAVRGACIVRSADGRRIPLSGTDSSCVNGTLRRRAIGASADTVTRGTIERQGVEHFLLAIPMRSVTGRNSGVLSLELDVAALFDQARPLGGVAVSSMLVDMGSSEVVATAPATAGLAEGAGSFDPTSVAPHVPGIVSEDDEAERELLAMGLASTVVPLWSNGDGTRMALVQLWPHQGVSLPLELRLALLGLLAGVITVVIVLMRYFLHPIQEMAESRAELAELYDEARQDALADGLTGLGNHRAFQEALARVTAAYERGGSTFSLVLIDLDDLKVVNDRDGHSAGDDMLRAMADTMRHHSRPHDRLYRTGGDEFAIILPDTGLEDAAGVAERMLHFSKRPGGGARPAAFSAGVSGVPWMTRNRETVYLQADAALYWAKRHGRGSVEAFDPERDQLPDETTDATASAIAEVLTGKRLRPVFQPIVDLRTGRILGFEGLIRPDPNGPLPDTGRLFAAAAASGRTVELDLACIEAVVQGARAIGPDRLLTLNLSPRTLEVKDFDAAWLLQSLVRAGISPSRVILELTEREEIDDLPRLRQTFASLQQYGLRLAADDVGAGNSGLRLLSQVQFDIVKIDLALVHDGVRRLGARAVLQSLRDLALSQNARIVAEGVETAQQLRAIRELDIGAGQGFLLGRPDVSLEKTFVDVKQLASGVVVPGTGAVAPVPTGAVIDTAADAISPERRAVFLPPAQPTLTAEPGPA